jgi:RimJ/RimL family protein N-acetyltransferase
MDYGSDWSARHALPDGTQVLLRPIQPSDRDDVARQFARMSPDSRFRRFFTGIRELTPEMLDHLTLVDGVDHYALVATVESLDLKLEEGIGVARFVRLASEPDIAEAAVTVVDDYQGRGVGRLLLTTLVAAAQARSVRKFRGEVLVSNEPMRRLLEGAGAQGRPTEDATLEYDIPIDAAAPGSLTRRILAGVATSMVVWLSRLYPEGRPPRHA